MRLATAFAVAVMLATPLLAEQRHVVSAAEADFASVKTFSLQEGRATTKRPELNNPLIFQKVGDAIRKALVSKGLTESATQSDVTIGFVVGEDRPNGPSVIFNRGTLVIDVTARDGNTMIWQGVYTDNGTNPAKIADKLPGYVQKLLSMYPPKKKK